VRGGRGGGKGEYLVDEDDAGDDLRHALVDVPLHDAVHLPPELVRDLAAARLHERAHDAHDVLPALRARVRRVEVREAHVLHELLALVHVALGQRHVRLALEVVRARVRVAAAHALDRAAVRLDVHDVADGDLLAQQRLVDRGVQPERLAPLGTLEADDDVAHALAVAPKRVLRLRGRQLRHLALIHLFRLLHAHADRAPERLREHRRLAHLRAVHLAPDHRAERHARAQLRGERERERGLARPRRAREEERAPRELARLDQGHDHPARLRRSVSARAAERAHAPRARWPGR
jgi:hypothetical protein